MASDPDRIEREIERSRAQLAQAVDAIADRVSPRRVMARGVSRAKAALESWRERLGSGAGVPLSGGSGEPGGGTDLVTVLTASGRSLLTAAGSRANRLGVSPDRVAPAVGLATAAVLLTVLVRSQRR